MNLMNIIHIKRVTRFERATSTLARLRSTPELHPLKNVIILYQEITDKQNLIYILHSNTYRGFFIFNFSFYFRMYFANRYIVPAMA